MATHAPQHVVTVHIADDDERRIVRHVIASVIAVKIVARHRLQIGEPADGRMTIGVRLERGRGELLIEQLIGIVLAALQFRDDHGALGLAVVGMVQAARHPFRLDEQHPIERVARRRLEIRRLIDPGVAVPAAAVLLDQPLHLVAGNVLGALEVHVLAPVRDAGDAGMFVLRADAVPAPDRRERRGMFLLDEHFEAVLESRATHPNIIESVDTHA